MNTDSLRFSLYGFCLFVSAGLVGFFAISIEHFIGYINNIIIPCQHDSIWQDGRCVCDNTKGIFGGEFCETCQCQHLGICRMSSEGAVDTRWSCRCPTHQKWVGITCDKCYATHNTSDQCKGHCIENHYGQNCNTHCIPGIPSNTERKICSEVQSSGGKCNICNGHGTCSNDGECQCDDGFFTSRNGDKCILSCESCPSERGVCQSVGGQLQCICKDNYFGVNCEQTCKSSNDLVCSGHGVCQFSAKRGLECVCNPMYIGDDCSAKCPGRDVVAEPCNGHGTCVFDSSNSPVCQCSAPWESFDCGCVDEYTCNGHGVCNPDYDGTNNICNCLSVDADVNASTEERRYGGQHCEKCQENWWGSRCHLFCDRYAVSQSGGHLGKKVGCNGHGSCVINKVAEDETIECECQSNYESKKQCAECKEMYFPKVFKYGDGGDKMSLVIPKNAEHCSVSCSGENECHSKGKCNPDYDTTNHICICDGNGKDGSLNTLDPEVGCSACQTNWYPKDLNNPITRCTNYCADSGTLDTDEKIIRFGTDLDLQNDTFAKDICTKVSGGYKVNPVCHVCSGNGKCNPEGGCTCNEGTTGTYCEIDCGNGNEACSGHGRCVRDELEMWFYPDTNNFRCECLPYDPYTSEARLNLIKQGVAVDLPPAPNYYGKYCDYHCPTYNSQVCAGRGVCDTKIALNNQGVVQECTSDAQCREIDGIRDSFCEVLSTPWDSIVPRFFSIGAESLGYKTCTSISGTSCIDTIYSVDWGNYCVQMLNGWYPNQLNTVNCAFDNDYRIKVEDFFMNEYKDGQTFCEHALKELTPSMNKNVCNRFSYPNKIQFDNDEVICQSFTLQSSCQKETKCVYDQTIDYITQVDSNCATRNALNCNGYCTLDSNQVCKTKTYCRAKNCADAISEKSLESMCLEYDNVCPTQVKNLSAQCSVGLNNIRNSANDALLNVSSVNIFFVCSMFKNIHSPTTISQSVPGDIEPNGILTTLGRNVPVQEYRNAFIQSRSSVVSCDNVEFNASSFCDNHLSSVLTDSKWYMKESPFWFLPWRLKCGQYITLWSSETLAKTQMTKFMQNASIQCTINNAGDIAVRPQQWSLQCLEDEKLQMYTIGTRSFPLPYANAGCTLKENVMDARWGQKQWVHNEIENIYQETCLKASKSKVIPEVPVVPDFCAARNPCGVHGCQVCSGINCDYVECKHNTNLQPVCTDSDVTCGDGGTCISMDTKKGVYKCKYGIIQQFNDMIAPIVQVHRDYRDVNWLKHCSHVVSVPMPLDRKNVLNDVWALGSEVLYVSNGKYLFQKAVIDTSVAVIVKVSVDVQLSENDAVMSVVCNGDDITVFNIGNMTINLPIGTCTLETIGKIIVSSILVDNVETISHNSFDFEEGSVTVFPLSLKNYIEFNDINTITFNKKNSYDISAADDSAGVQWILSKEDESIQNVRISGWIWLPSTNAEASMKLMSAENKNIVDMSIMTDGESTTVTLNGGDSCKIPIGNKWNRWYMESKLVNETIVKNETTYHHIVWHVSLYLSDSISGQKCMVNNHINHLSNSRIMKVLNRIAPSFNTFTSKSKDDCHQQCLSHSECVQWSWTEQDKHCYMYNKRCHEDKRCMHGTHTLHSSHSHPIHSFVIDTDSLVPITWGHIHHDQIVHKSPVNFYNSYTDIINTTINNYPYKAYLPDTTTVCNDLANTFHNMPGYKTYVCNGPTCSNGYNEKNMSMCAQFIDNKYPKEHSKCDALKNLNWTAYCHYENSFHARNLDDNNNYFPILGTTSSYGNMNDICKESYEFKNKTQNICNTTTETWFKQCLGRWQSYEEYCDDSCLTYIQDALSSDGALNKSICEKRDEYLQLNISGNIEKDQFCSKKVEELIITDFCQLQNTYHDKGKLVMPSLKPSCSQDCTNMLTNELNRTQWRNWCYQLSSGTIKGTCSRTSCKCDTAENIGVAGEMCELTCPSGTENGQEIACSGRNGNCFAADYNQISADTTKQIAQKEFRPENNITMQQTIKDNYKPLWLAGPNPSATGICQCTLGSGDSCSIPCDNCNNGTYGVGMASQYGICDAYYGLCRSLPPFMRLNVKKQTDVVMSYNSTNFNGMQWSNPDDFLYEDDSVLLDAAIMDEYDLQGSSYGILSVDDGQLGFQQQQMFLDVLDIFPRLCTQNGVWLEAPGFTWEGSTKYLSNQKKIQNSGLSMLYGQSYDISTYKIKSWGPCNRIDMNDEWFICFENGRLHAMGTNGQAMALFSMGQYASIPLSGISFVKASSNTVYAFGGSSSYSNSNSEALSNTLYKITLRKRRWENNFVVLAHWEIVPTVGNIPVKQKDASIVYLYNELYLLSIVNNEPSIYVLPFTLDGSAAKWTLYGKVPIQGNMTTIAPDNSRTRGNRIYLYIDDIVLLFSKELGFVTIKSYPPKKSLYIQSPGFMSEEQLNCRFEIKNISNVYNLEFGQNVLVSHTKQPLNVFVYLEEWLNLDTKISRNIYKQFLQSIEWRVNKEIVPRDVIQQIQLPKAINMVEKIYMQQGRWKLTSMLFHTSEMYKSLSRNDLRFINPSVGIIPSEIFLDIIKKNDASLLLDVTSFVSALPANIDGKTVISVNVEGQKYSKDIIIMGHRREFIQANIQYPYIEELLFQNGVIEIVIVNWSDNAFVLELRRQGDKNAEIKWVETQNIKTFHVVVHIEEWMYNSASDTLFTVNDLAPGYSDWQALFNMFVSIHPESTARMKTQTNNFLQYYGSHCSATSDQQCPGILLNTHMACSGHGRCNSVCNCECELAPSILQNNANAYQELSHWQTSPYRGDGCQITCPGFDGYDINSICSGNPNKCGRDGKCACDPGETGDACQFRCPSVKIDGKFVTCAGNGGCSTKSIEMNSTIFTRDIYKNRVSAINRNSYISALSKHYNPCQEFNYYPVKGDLIDVIPFKHQSGLIQSFVDLKQAKYFCDKININYYPDLSNYETHLLPQQKCIGIKKIGNQYQPMEYQMNNLYYQPDGTSNLVKLFACTFSDCELSRHIDDKKTMSNIDFYLDPPKFEFHGIYKHGFSSGTITFSINAQKISLDIEWDLKNIKIDIIEEYTLIKHTVLQTSGSYKRFVLLIDGNSVRVRLYKMKEYDDNSQSQSWLVPIYGKKYRISDKVKTGYAFNVPSDDTGIDTPILILEQAEYACDIQEDCSGIIQWEAITRGTLFSLYTYKNVVGSSILYPISDEIGKQNDFIYLHKMSMFYKGKNEADLTSTCAVIKARQASYPMVNYSTTYNIPVTDINFTSVVEPQTKAVEIGNGIWTNCWEKQDGGVNIKDCYQTCRSKSWHGFAWSNVTNTCLCYRINKNNIKLNKYTDSLHSTDSKSVYNPCDVSNQNTPKTSWIYINQ